MRLRAGLIIGFAAGYVLGAKAGRERYEQIRSATESVMRSGPAIKVRERANEAIHEASETVRSLARVGGDADVFEVEGARAIHLP